MAHGAEPATVSSLHELYRWVDHTIGFVANATGQGPVPLRGQMAERSKGFTMSTAFSGIGAPENALHAIMCHLGCECSRPLCNIEWDLECRRELCALPHPPMCLFDDINQFWNETIDMGSISSVSQYEKLIKSGIGILPHGWCLLHLRTCKLQTAECHIGGTPCPDWSSQGSRNKEAGPDAMATMAWIGQRYTLEEPIWINENVAAFDWFLMCNILCEKYIMVSCILKSEQVWVQRRHRRITVGVNKKLIKVQAPWDIFPKFKRSLQVTWLALLRADKSELDQELQWSRSRPSSLHGKDFDQVVAGDSDCSGNPTLVKRMSELRERSAFVASLSIWELKNLSRYLDVLQDPEEVPFDLGQDALVWPYCGTRQVLPTIIRNVHMLFTVRLWRWFMPTELLRAQAFHLDPESKQHHERSSFDVPRAFKRQRACVARQAGNSMNVVQIGGALVWALACTERMPSSVNALQVSQDSHSPAPEVVPLAPTPRPSTAAAMALFRAASGRDTDSVASVAATESASQLHSASLCFHLASGKKMRI